MIADMFARSFSPKHKSPAQPSLQPMQNRPSRTEPPQYQKTEKKFNKK
jgi:hypothetical protein